MGKLAANDITRRARYEVRRLLNPTRRLCDNAGIKFIPAVDHIIDRYTPTSAADTTERQRSALEKLLASVEPFDAAPLSTALMKEFTSLRRVFGESKEALERVVGCNSNIADLLQAAHGALVESLYSEIHLRLIPSVDQSLVDYLVASMAPLPVERLRILFFDQGNHLIGDEVLAQGSLTTLTAYPRNIFKRAFELSSSSILLVHNHPGGNVEPSECDIHFTQKLIRLGKALEIDVRDHIIIAGSKWFSFSRRGLI